MHKYIFNLLWPVKWNQHIAKAEISHLAIAGVLLKAKKELQQSIDFSKLLTKPVITVVRYIISSQFIDFHTFSALTFQTKASSLALWKRGLD